jgi:hypothetical protein
MFLMSEERKVPSIDDITKLAKDMLIAQGFLRNHLVAFKDNKLMYFPVIHKDDDDSKDEMLLALRATIIALDVPVYFHVTEAWMSQDITQRPKLAKDRKEVLIIQKFSKDLSFEHRMIWFHKEGNKIIFEKEDNMKKAEWRSRFNFYLEDAMEETIAKQRIEKAVADVPQAELDRLKGMIKDAMGIEITDDQARNEMRKFLKKQSEGKDNDVRKNFED